MIKHRLGFRSAALALAVGLGALWTASAQAAGGLNVGRLYYGITGGIMMPDIGGWDDAVNIGGLVGAPVARLPQGTISVEGELTTSLIRGDINYFGFNGKWRLTTLGGYGVFRTNGPMYLKAKAGLMYDSIGISTGGLPGYGSGTDITLGVGGGMRLRGGQKLELEYTIIDSNFNMLSVNYIF